jgi:hypothetical protein
MHGDFSTRYGAAHLNFAGVLHQQGRVSLDTDGNAATAIAADWQDTEARDVIGAGVAAVPAALPNSFKVETASVDAGGTVTITVDPGRIWVDGILVRLRQQPPIARVATYLQPPVQDPPATSTPIGARDAVVLEVWRESLSAFQRPDILIEPALGGPDTTERLHTSFDFRLYRLGPGDDCAGLDGLLGDRTAERGHLTVTLTPPTMIPGDCPVFEGGGYTGFEHNLYRIEIADVNAGAPQFKWSRFNGGLVGRANFDLAGHLATITANLQAVASCGSTDFYLEALVPELDALTLQPVYDRWRVVYGAPVTLNNDNDFVLPTVPTFQTADAQSGIMFFRLWDGIQAIAAYPTGGTPNELVAGICLAFEANGTGKYTPGDYWAFPLRAGGIPNPITPVDDRPPDGIRHHRVPLAILDWESTGISAADDLISDCREIFTPHTRRDSCCTVRVGDGIQSHGDFTTIQAAINSLPAAGGKVCVLPGLYTENVIINGRRDIVVSGCGPRSRVVSGAPNPKVATSQPVFWIRNSQGITIEHLRIDAAQNGIGVLIDGQPTQAAALTARAVITGPCRNIMLRGLSIFAAMQCAIEVRAGSVITIRECTIVMTDRPTSRPGIFFVADDGLIERNVVRVQTRAKDPTVMITEGTRVVAQAALGGIQLGGTCERVRVLDNIVQGGIGTGIVLGSILVVDGDGNDTGGGVIVDPCEPCKPGNGFIPPGGGKGTRYVSAGPLYDIYIERNRVLDMGLNGIGVIGFWNLRGVDQMISVDRLTIVANEIRYCLRRPLAEIPPVMLTQMGYGGIALADVDYLVVRENVIENNGPDFAQPVCGIFVLHGEGVDIAGNRIENNGAKTGQPMFAAKSGARGGIIVVFAIAPAVPTNVQFFGIALPNAPVQNGFPALRVHENIVSAPVGQALSAMALGPVSVHGNSLTTHGIAAARGAVPPAAATVSILNLGLSNEAYLQLLAFTLLAITVLGLPGVVETDDAIVIPAAGLDDLGIGRLLADGTVQFTDNQVVLDLLEVGVSSARSSVLVASLDDVEFADNQCTSNLAGDLVLIQAIILGFSVRVEANRFTESLVLAFLSALTFGVVNTTSHNQGTHCIIAAASTPALLTNAPNAVLYPSALCPRAAKLVTTLRP